eukprot:2805952-Pleurochrysis_carterae.AAC.1
MSACAYSAVHQHAWRKKITSVSLLNAAIDRLFPLLLCFPFSRGLSRRAARTRRCSSPDSTTWAPSTAPPSTSWYACFTHGAAAKWSRSKRLYDSELPNYVIT